MAKKSLVVALLVAVSVPMVGGCGLPWQDILIAAATQTGFEFVLDNDSVFDLFQDDFGTGALYNDRLTANPSRQEP
jgi:hypothetical protein